jgi:fermentation-respiration switch protein FrsA (DUF1100 family)
MARFLLIGVGIVCGLYLLAVVAMFTLQRQLQYHATNRGPSPGEAGFRNVEEHLLVASDGTEIVLWHSPAPAGATTILYLHGNGGEMADRPKRFATYQAAGLGVAYLSYRGFGPSKGEITEAGLHDDAATAYQWLLGQGVQPARLAVVGESLGTGVAVRLAAEHQVGALLLEAPYTATADIAAAVYPWLPVRLLMLDQFRSIDHIARVQAPLFVLHGDLDSTIPLPFGQALFELANEPKEFHLARDKGHEALFDPETWALELDFIARFIPSGSP